MSGTVSATIATDGRAQVASPRLPVEPPALPVEPPPLPPPRPPVQPPAPPVRPPSLPVKPPDLPVKPPDLPVKPPDLPVEPPSAPVDPPAIESPRAPTRGLAPGTPSRGAPALPEPSPPAGGAPAATPVPQGSRQAPGGYAPSRSGVAGWPAVPPELLRGDPETPLSGQRLRRMRALLREHSECLGALAPRARRVLELRAGLLGDAPGSPRTIGRRLGLSPGATLRLERSSLRRLVAADTGGGCAAAAAAGAGSAVGGPPGARPGDPTGEAPPGSNDGGAGGDGSPTSATLADVHEGGPGIDLGDGQQGPTETLLFLLLTVLALLGPTAAAVARRQAHAAATAGTRPLLFLDVDGVIALCALYDDLPPGERCESPVGIVHLPARAGELVRELATRFDLVWATGWERHANAVLLGPLGLDEKLPVLTFGKQARFGSADWKLERVSAYARGRPAAWVDDNFEEVHERWAAARPEPTLLVAVDPGFGLAPDHVERLLRWADDRAAASGRAAQAAGRRRVRAS